MADGAGGCADQEAAGRPWARRLAVPLALVALVAAVHAGSLRNPFQYDDRSFIVENEHVRAWPGPLRYLRPPVLDSRGTVRAFYRPVTMLSFWASFRLGTSATGFRVVDLGLHAAAVLLLAALAGRLLVRLAAGGRFPAPAVAPTAALAGALLAVHPLATQTINEISKRDTLLAAVFTLGALLAYLGALERAERDAAGARGWLRLTLVGALLQALALGSKEVAVAAPVLLLLCDWLVLRPARPAAPRRLAVYAVGAALSAALGVAFLVWAARGGYPAPLPREPVPPAWQYVLGQPLVVLRYFGLLVSPSSLSAYHEVAVVTRVASAGFLLPALGLAGLVALAVAVRRRTPEVTLAVVGGVVHLLPTSLARNPIAMDEDRAYLLLALYGLAAAGLLGRAGARLAQRRGRAASRAVAGVALVALAALATVSVLRSRDWRTPVTLWGAAVEVYPTSRTALLFLAGALAAEGRQADRLRVLAAAARAHPRDVRTRIFYAHALAVADRPVEAHALARQLEQEAPESDEVQTLLGHLHRASGALAAAAAAYRRALRLDPGSVTACVYLADCLGRLGDPAEARRLLRCVPPHAGLSANERAVVDNLLRGSR
jgi:Flp pilus assembly protein TadD